MLEVNSRSKSWITLDFLSSGFDSLASGGQLWLVIRVELCCRTGCLISSTNRIFTYFYNVAMLHSFYNLHQQYPSMDLHLQFFACCVHVFDSSWTRWSFKPRWCLMMTWLHWRLIFIAYVNPGEQGWKNLSVGHCLQRVEEEYFLLVLCTAFKGEILSEIASMYCQCFPCVLWTCSLSQKFG